MLPRVSPLTVRSQKKPQFFQGGKKIEIRSGACCIWRRTLSQTRAAHQMVGRSPYCVSSWCALQGDRLEDLAVRLVEAELPARQLTVLGELDREAEDRLRDVRLGDLGAYLRAGRLAVLAGTVDRLDDDLGGDAGRSAEVVAVAAVRLGVRLD